MRCSKCYGELSFCKECSENEQIKLLKDQLQFGIDLVHSLKAENARYRKALEFCAEQVIWHDEKNQDVILTYGYCVNRARKALKGE